MDTIQIGKRANSSGNISPVIMIYDDNLSHYNGKDLIFECQNSQTRAVANSEIPLKIAGIRKNIINIHKTSNGTRDCECFLHLIRMINESALLIQKISQDLINKNIISRNQTDKISGYIDPRELAEYYATIFVVDESNSSMLDETFSFIAERFLNAYNAGFENRIIDLNEEKKLFDNFQMELSNNKRRKR